MRRTDKRPTADIHGRVVVGMGSEPTGDAAKGVLRRPVGPFDVAAGGAGLRSVGRVNVNNRNAGQLRLVGDKSLQLMERPRMQIVSLLATKPYPRTDALEVFEGNPTCGAFRKW